MRPVAGILRYHRISMTHPDAAGCRKRRRRCRRSWICRNAPGARRFRPPATIKDIAARPWTSPRPRSSKNSLRLLSLWPPVSGGTVDRMHWRPGTRDHVMPRSEAEVLITSLRDPRLAVHAVGALPAWLWAADGSRVLWTNEAGAAVFGRSSASELVARHFGPADQHRRQVARLAGQLPDGAVRLERLQGFGAALGRLRTCACSRIGERGRQRRPAGRGRGAGGTGDGLSRAGAAPDRRDRRSGGRLRRRRHPDRGQCGRKKSDSVRAARRGRPFGVRPRPGLRGRAQRRSCHDPGGGRRGRAVPARPRPRDHAAGADQDSRARNAGAAGTNPTRRYRGVAGRRHHCSCRPSATRPRGDR